ncbi:MAG: ExbD/TolR family protein [bacterium]
MFEKPIFERKEEDSDGLGIILAPLIDIVFLLLIFFAVSTTFTMQPGLTVELPRGGGEQEVEPQRWVITMTAEREIFLNRDRIELEQLFTTISSDPLPVILRADRSIPHGVIVTILDQVRNAGIESVNISTLPLD